MRIISNTAVFAAIAIAAISTPAAAEQRTAYVEVADLDINSDVGMATLQGRIRVAIADVCPRGRVRSITDSMDANACRLAASEDADRQISQLRRGHVEILAIRADRSETRNQ